MPPALSKRIYQAQERLLGRPTFSYLADLEKSQYLPRQEIETLQLERLQKLLQIALEHCPWHAKRIRSAGIDANNLSWESFRRLPLMTKGDARRHGSEMIWQGVPGGAHPYSTGGSSGQPLTFHFGRWRQASDAAGRMRARRWWGVNPGDPEVYLWGAPVELKKTDWVKSLRDRFMNHMVLNAFAMSAESMARYVSAIRSFRPKCIYGYASSIALLAGYLHDNGGSLQLPSLRVVCTTGEPLYPHQKELIGEVFGVPVANEFGSRDIGFTAHETPEGQMLLMSESIVLEVLDEQGQPVPDGETGEAVMTGLLSQAQPFIRYRTGDVIRLSREKNKGGRGLHVIEKVIGRTTDFLVHQDGSVVHALAAIYIVREIPGIDQFKIIQEAVNRFQIQVVTNSRWQPQDREAIAMGFKKRFGDNIGIQILETDAITPEASGKYRQVVSNVTHPWQAG